MLNFTREMLRKLAEVHYAIKEDGERRDGEEGVHFALGIHLLTPAANRVYHERILELDRVKMDKLLASLPKLPTGSQAMQLTPPPPPAVNAKQIIAAVKAKKKLTPAQLKQRREAAKKTRKR